ncbi:uncharacterized protein LOC142355607 [Convolutriloba macropyga]|uniref:uncharacterized protein LOC142355607 n=1 Tax=Convolutriloba macropyga TaxID=536237 RepID=UPI003F51C606
MNNSSLIGSDEMAEDTTFADYVSSVAEDFQSASRLLVNDILIIINAYVTPIVGFIGIVLNSLGIATLFHMGINSSSMVFMLILCIGDIISGFVDSILIVG